MSFLKNAVLTVCMLSVISTLFMMLVPDRFRRDIKSVISLIAAVAIVTLILGADFSDLGTDFNSIEFQQSTASRNRLIQSEVESRAADIIASFLEENGISCKNIAVRTTIDGQNSIFITETDILLDSSEKEREQFVRSIIAERVGDIEVKIRYEDS